MVDGVDDDGQEVELENVDGEGVKLVHHGQNMEVTLHPWRGKRERCRPPGSSAFTGKVTSANLKILYLFGRPPSVLRPSYSLATHHCSTTLQQNTVLYGLFQLGMLRGIRMLQSLSATGTISAKPGPFPRFCRVNPSIECGVTDQHSFYGCRIGGPS